MWIERVSNYSITRKVLRFRKATIILMIFCWYVFYCCSLLRSLFLSNLPFSGEIMFHIIHNNYSSLSSSVIRLKQLRITSVFQTSLSLFVTWQKHQLITNVSQWITSESKPTVGVKWSNPAIFRSISWSNLIPMKYLGRWRYCIYAMLILYTSESVPC